MSALPAKPSLRHSVSEWASNNRHLSNTAQQERNASNVIRQEGRSLRNEANCKTCWDESDTSRRLSDRAWDVARCKEALESCALKVDQEMEALAQFKETTEQALAATAVPLEVSKECLALRDGRRGHELVSDPVDEQLQKEVELIERAQHELQQHVDKAFEQLCALQEARNRLAADIQDKTEALDIDLSCLSLTITSPQISLKTNPTRVPSGSSTPKEWGESSHHNLVCAEEAVQASQQLREETSLSRAQLQNELDGQCRATEFALRKRSHQEEQARGELEWQIKNTTDEMSELEEDIHGLGADMRAKTASLKLAHTRLENRTSRPGKDLCRDEVQHGLVDEVHQLEVTIATLQQKLSEAQYSLQRMKLHHSHMLQDLSRKQEALSLERRSMNTRSRLKTTSGALVPLVPLRNSVMKSKLQLLAQ